MSEIGFTIEDVNAMQDEMNKIEGIEDESIDKDKSGDKVDEKLNDEKLPDVKDGDKVIDNKDDEKVKDDKDDKEVNSVDVIRELKEQLRISNESLGKVTGDYQKLHKVLIDKGLITEEEVKADKEAADAVKAAYDARQEKLTEMVSIMEVNPVYADIREVCTQSNMDDVIEAFARYWVKENGGTLQETTAKLESEIWSEPNPYKRLYDIIKQYHPKYASKKDEKDDKKDEDKSKKSKEPIDAQPSAAGIGAGGTGSGNTGWTAEKIDALDEDELKNVPKDIYEKYLAGTLK